MLFNLNKQRESKNINNKESSLPIKNESVKEFDRFLIRQSSGIFNTINMVKCFLLVKIMGVLENYIEALMPKLTQYTCKKLEQNKTDLENVTWSSNESNLDKGFSEIAKKCCEEAFKECNLRMNLKLEVEPKDLELLFTENQVKIKKKIELKSSKKKNKFKGSTILKLDENIWTILCNRENKNFEFKYGRYFLGMKRSPFDLFQDRSPRPDLIFDNYQSSNEEPKTKRNTKDNFSSKHYAQCAINRILNPKMKSWQDAIILEVIKEVKNNPDRFRDI